jgi:hypothetical protein
MPFHGRCGFDHLGRRTSHQGWRMDVEGAALVTFWCEMGYMRMYYIAHTGSYPLLLCIDISVVDARVT